MSAVPPDPWPVFLQAVDLARHGRWDEAVQRAELISSLAADLDLPRTGVTLERPLGD